MPCLAAAGYHTAIMEDIPLTPCRLALPPLGADRLRDFQIRLLEPGFRFGSNFFGLMQLKGPQLKTCQQELSALWNSGTLPFYWGTWEPKPGRTRRDVALKAARWARARGIHLKGHPLVWHSVCAPWLLELPDSRILELQLGRIRREIQDFAGLVDTWDVVNEGLILPQFDRYDNAVSRLCRWLGRDQLLLRCFQAAREADPGARLLINDFNLGPEYHDLIARLLDAACPLDGIGLQTHMHQGAKSPDWIEGVIRRFEVFGLPLHFSELTLLSGDLVPADIIDLNDAARPHWPSTPEGEARQMAQALDFYRQVAAHPACASITWWDLQDGNWLNAPSGLLRRDGSHKPLRTALEGLLDRYLHREPISLAAAGCLQTGSAGLTVEFKGPWGRYCLEDKKGWYQEFDLPAAGGMVRLDRQDLPDR